MYDHEASARARIGRLARQLLRQERRAALLSAHAPDDDREHAERERAILESSRRIALETIATLADRIADEALRARCAALIALYDTHARTRAPGTTDGIVELLVTIAGELPSERLGRFRAAS